MSTDTPLIHDGAHTVASFNGSNTAALQGPGSSAQFLGVKVSTSTDGQVDLAGAGDRIYGVLQNKPALGQAADVGIFGVSKAVLGAVVTVGQLLMMDASSRMVPQTSTSHIVGRALEGGNTGNIVSVEVNDLGTIA